MGVACQCERGMLRRAWHVKVGVPCQGGRAMSKWAWHVNAGVCQGRRGMSMWAWYVNMGVSCQGGRAACPCDFTSLFDADYHPKTMEDGVRNW